MKYDVDLTCRILKGHLVNSIGNTIGVVDKAKNLDKFNKIALFGPNYGDVEVIELKVFIFPNLDKEVIKKEDFYDLRRAIKV